MIRITEELVPDLMGKGDAFLIDQAYNALDCCVTREVWDVLHPRLDADTGRIYRFEHACQMPAITMSLRGMQIDPVRQRVAIDVHSTEEAQAQRETADLAADVWDAHETRPGPCDATHRQHLWPRDVAPAVAVCKRCGLSRLRPAAINAGSPQQVSHLLYDLYGIQKRRNRSTGKPTTDDEALEGIQAEELREASTAKRPETREKHNRIAAVCAAILRARKARKQIGYAKSKLGADGRMRSSFSVGATETGRWSASAAPDWTGWNCLTGDHEVLTPSGWVRIEDWLAGVPIVVGNGTDLWFEEASKITKPAESLISLSTPWVSSVMTPQHRLPYFTQEGKFMEAPAEDRRSMYGVPLGGMLRGRFVPEATTREWLRDAKVFGPWLLQHDPSVVVDELSRWDGGNKSPQYYSTNLTNVEWVQTLMHLAGGKGHILVQCEELGNRKKCWRIGLQGLGRAEVRKEDYYESDALPSKVYCATTTPGFFLIRHNGKISLTGNCQQISKRLKAMIVADPGLEIWSADYKAAESQFVAYDAEDEAYIEAHKTSDVHTTVCQLAWPELPWTDDPELNKAFAKTCPPFDPHHSYRDFAKRIQHGGNMGRTPQGVARQIHISQEDAEILYARMYGGTKYKRVWRDGKWHMTDEVLWSYPGAFPMVKARHRALHAELKRTGITVSCLGRKRQFFGRTWDDETLREALGQLEQSPIADVLNLSLIRIWSELDTRANIYDAPHPSQSNRVWLLAQVHDAIWGLRRIGDDDALRRVRELMTIPILINGRVCTIPVDITVGHSLSEEEQKPWQG